MTGAEETAVAGASAEKLYRDALIRMGAGVLGWLIASFVFLRFLGIGGVRFGWLLCAAVIGGGATAIIWLTARPLPSLSSYIASAAMIGLALGVNIASTAPLSAPRVGEYLDSVGIEGEVVRETASGSVRCDPTCPTVTRDYRMGFARTSAAQTTVEGRLLTKGASSKDLVRARDRIEGSVREGRVVATFRRDGQRVIATVTMTATRR